VDTKDVLIVGAGPAGIATAIQLKRYNIEPVLLEQGEIGGLLRNANLVENYPGFPQGINGLGLVELFARQLENAGVRVTFERVLEIEYRDGTFFTQTDGETFTSAAAVVATGTRSKPIADLPISDEVKSRVFCEVYPLLGAQGKRIAIIGAGDAAFDYALNLSGRNQVVILNRGKKTSCVPILWERCAKRESISYLPDVTLRAIKNEKSRAVLDYTDNDSQREMRLIADYVVLATGRVPRLDILGTQLKKRSAELIGEKKLHLVGDVSNGTYRQTAICVGDGVKAAMGIFRNKGRDCA
jgi:thioredoxin reductase (NADPH)